MLRSSKWFCSVLAQPSLDTSSPHILRVQAHLAENALDGRLNDKPPSLHAMHSASLDRMRREDCAGRKQFAPNSDQQIVNIRRCAAHSAEAIQVQFAAWIAWSLRSSQ
jgi:hypothetical protein